MFWDIGQLAKELRVLRVCACSLLLFEAKTELRPTHKTVSAVKLVPPRIAVQLSTSSRSSLGWCALFRQGDASLAGVVTVIEARADGSDGLTIAALLLIRTGDRGFYSGRFATTTTRMRQRVKDHSNSGPFYKLFSYVFPRTCKL